jgi:hypothetical protein
MLKGLLLNRRNLPALDLRRQFKHLAD